MNQVRIGTIVPGDRVHDLLPEFIKSGFECFALNFHMEFPDESLAAFAERVKAAVDGEMPEISSIGYYCNPLENEEQLHILEKFIDGAHLFNTNMVTTFAGALYSRPVEEAIPVYKKVFGELAKRAEANGVRLSIENCTMGGTWRRATYNIGFNPRAWQMMFDAVDSPAIGLEWEPAHQMVQLIDPVPQLEEWIGRVYHLHGKDANIDWNKVKKYGVSGASQFAIPRTPGYGDTDWRVIFDVLYRHNFSGDLCVEGFHDDIFNGDLEVAGQKHALRYLKWCRGI